MANATENNEAATEQQESNATPPQEAPADNANTDDIPVDVLRKQLADARKEAARYRNERNDLKDDAQAWRDKQEAEKSEIERLQEQNAANEQRLAEVEAERLKLTVAHSYGLEPDDVALLGSGDKETLEARAARISELYKKAAPQHAAPNGRPLESVRSGAGEAEEKPDNAYPSNWI